MHLQQNIRQHFPRRNRSLLLAHRVLVIRDFAQQSGRLVVLPSACITHAEASFSAISVDSAA